MVTVMFIENLSLRLQKKIKTIVLLIELNSENEDESEKTLDVFDRNGKFTSSVQIAGDTPYRFSRQTKFQKRSFWLVKTGENELYRVIKYSIEAESMPLHSNRNELKDINHP